jgi:hypothetical protein
MALTGIYGDADLPYLLGEDFGVVVVCAGVTTVGIKDQVGKDSLLSSGISGVSGTEISITVQTSVWPVVPNRTPLTVDGAAMFIRDQQLEGDGGTMKILCSVTRS